MRARLVFGLLVSLYCLSFFFRGKDPLEQMGDTVMEGVFFQGGYGLQWIFDTAEEFEHAHPDVTAYVWGNPRAWDQTRPRFLSGNPPDVFWGIHNINFWVNLEDGLVANLDSLMEVPAYGQEHIKFKDTFFPGSLDEGKYQGSQYFLPITYAVLGIWYNKGMFDEHGWSVPVTWDDFRQLCALIRETTHIAPLTHQGRAPSYFGIIYRGLVYKLGGDPLVCDLDSLVPGAWARAEMGVMAVPGPAAGKGGVRAIEASSGPAFWVPREGDRAEWGMEYLRILLSKKMAANFLRTVGCLQPVIGSTEGVEVPAALQSALDAVEAAEGETFGFRYPHYYLEMETEFRNAFGSLLNGSISPEEFAGRMEDQAERLRRDLG